jgi:hypothetical protein
MGSASQKDCIGSEAPNQPLLLLLLLVLLLYMFFCRFLGSFSTQWCRRWSLARL